MSEPAGEQVSPEVANAEAERQYRLLQPKYEKLASEVEYIIQEALVEERVPVASLSRRTKSVASFADKLRRKTYKNPLAEVTDLAGVRIVSYFMGDLARLEYMIGRHFRVLEKVDKIAEKAEDKFGYIAVQFIVIIKENFLGPRYDDIQELKCEIQTRAVLADAWAILNHYLMYKRESELPTDIARKMYSLAAVLENAEGQFEEIRREVQRSRESARATTGDAFLDQSINQATVEAYLERSIPGIQTEDKEKEAAFICSMLDRTRFKSLANIEDAVRRTKKAVEALRKDTTMFAGQPIEYALAFADTSMRGRYADWFEALFRKHRHLVEGYEEH